MRDDNQRRKGPRRDGEMWLRRPDVIVCVGAGGVGKTTCSAALAHHHAAAGQRTLAITLDPARRLKEALEHSDLATLTVYQPRTEEAFETLVDQLFDGRPRDRKVLRANRIFDALGQSLAGMHELACIAMLPSVAADHDAEVIIVDTAPSRHALASIQLAGRVSALVDSALLAVIAGLLGSTRGGSSGRFRRALGRMARRPVAKILKRTVGERPVVEMMQLVELLLSVRGELSALAQQASALFAGPSARYVVVSAPSKASSDTAAYLASEIRTMKRDPTAFVLNRVPDASSGWAERLEEAADVPRKVRAAAAQLRREQDLARRELAQAVDRLQQVQGGAALITLPNVDAGATGVVASLAQRLGGSLPH